MYGTCGKDGAKCNNQFLADMKTACFDWDLVKRFKVKDVNGKV